MSGRAFNHMCRVTRLENKMLKSLFAGTALTAALLLSPAPAHAGLLPAFGDTVRVTSETEATGDTATITFAGLPGGKPLNVYSSPELLTGSFGAMDTKFANLLVYCTDLYDYSASPATYTVGHLTSSHQPSPNQDLTAGQVNNIATLIAAYHTDQAATQLAIWSVEYGTAFSFSNTSPTTVTDVKAYLAALNGSAPRNIVLYQLQDPGVQGFAYTGIPEPATIAVLGIALCGLMVAQRHRVVSQVSRVVSHA
jgi:hypothetical protein